MHIQINIENIVILIIKHAAKHYMYQTPSSGLVEDATKLKYLSSVQQK